MQGKVYRLAGVAFSASFCVMVLELVAGRIVARYLGTSLLTWTSVIGFVLAGIALGNYLGGRFSDRFSPRKFMPVIFSGASVFSFLIPWLNTLAGEWPLLWALPWTLRIALHIFVVFFIPAVLLGMAAPAVTNYALTGHERDSGRTVGLIYSWSAVGSIAGTFCTGFLLVPIFGSLKVLWVIAVLLALLGALFAGRMLLFYSLPFFLMISAGLYAGGMGAAKDAAAALGWVPDLDSETIYFRETPYSSIVVREDPEHPGLRGLYLDQIMNSWIDLEKPADVNAVGQYPYLRVFTAAAEALSRDMEDEPRFLVLGGGGYVFPRYLRKRWPDAEIHVVEIDPAVTEVAHRQLGLDRKTNLHIHHQDARTFVNAVTREMNAGKTAPFDAVFGDVVNGLTVPQQLTTREYLEKIKTILSPQGFYIMNLIDETGGGSFLGSLLKTFRAVFSDVIALRAGGIMDPQSIRRTFVLVGANGEIRHEPFANIASAESLKKSETEELMKRENAIRLTDDHAPTETLLMPVYHAEGRRKASLHYASKAGRRAAAGEAAEAVDLYRRALKEDSDAVLVHNNLANLLAAEGDYAGAEKHMRKVIDVAPRWPVGFINMATLLAVKKDFPEAETMYRRALEIDPSMTVAWYNLGTIQLRQGHVQAARNSYESALSLEPAFIRALIALADIYFEAEENVKAIEYYQKALTIQEGLPYVLERFGTLMSRQGRYEMARKYYRRALEADPDYKPARQNLEHVLARTQQSAKAESAGETRLKKKDNAPRKETGERSRERSGPA